MPYKKRRIAKSPNKNEERRQRNQTNLPQLRNIFPEIERLALDLRFYNRQGHLLQDDHFEYESNDPVNFLIPCPGGCGDGKTNLQSKISSVVGQRQPTGEGRAQCANPVYPTADLCACELRCQIRVVYRPEVTA